MDDEELRRRFHHPPTARDKELDEIKRQKIERGEIAKSVSYDPTQAIGLDDNLDPFPLTGDDSDNQPDTERSGTDEQRPAE